MNSRLEQFVHDVEVRLKTLPQNERDAEIAEIRQHLEALVAAEQELGASETAAIDEAIRRFGTAAQVSRRLVAAAWRYRLTRIPDPVAASLCAVITCPIAQLVSTAFAALVAHTAGLVLAHSDGGSITIQLSCDRMYAVQWALSLLLLPVPLHRLAQCRRTNSRFLSSAEFAGVAFAFPLVFTLEALVPGIQVVSELVPALRGIDVVAESSNACICLCILALAFSCCLLTRLAPQRALPRTLCCCAVTGVAGLLGSTGSFLGRICDACVGTLALALLATLLISFSRLVVEREPFRWREVFRASS